MNQKTLFALGLAAVLSISCLSVPQPVRADDDFVGAKPAVGLKTNDPLLPISWHFKAINAGQAWDYLKANKPKEKVRIAVLDTGCDMGHEDLQENINKDLSVDITKKAKNGSYAKLTGDIDTIGWHGTCVTGIIGATAGNGKGSTGLASGYDNDLVEVIPINVATKDDKGIRIKAEDEIAALKYAKSIGADVINISLGNYEHYSSLEKEIAAMVKSGCVVTSSAGNDNTDKPHYPSDYEDVIGVISIGKDGKRNGSNFGATKDISAPGEIIMTTVPASPSGYAGMNMTSAATPLISSAVALVKAAHPKYTVQQIKDALYKTATDLYEDGKDVDSGYGLVNVGRAVDNKAIAIKLKSTKKTLKKGKTFNLKAAVTSEYLTDKAVTYKSSNTKVLKVTSTGKVTAKAVGTATITVKHTASGLQKTCKVTVKKK